MMKKQTILLDHLGADGGDLSESEFQSKVLGGLDKVDAEVQTHKKATEKVLEDVSRLDKETKKTLEEMTKLQKVANDSQANHNALMQKFRDLDRQVRAEAKAAFGDPVKRIQADEEMRTRLNIMARMACDKRGDMQGTIKKMISRTDSSLREPIEKALISSTSPGSTLIDDSLNAEIYNVLEMYGVWNTFGTVPVGTRQEKFPVQTARPIAYVVLTDSTQIADDTNKTGSSVTCTVYPIACLLNVGIPLIEDAEVDLTPTLLEDFAQANAYRLDWLCTRADGSADSTDGNMTGVIPGGTAANAASGNSTIETTDHEDWTRTVLTVDAGVLNASPRWWMHPQTIVRALHVKDGNGRPIFMNALEAPSPGAIGSILGFPVTPAAIMPVTNAAASTPVVFGDPRGLAVGIRKSFEFASSDEFRWDYYQRSFRGISRAGVIVKSATSFAVLTLTA